MQKKRTFFNIETILVLLIALCVIFLNAFTTGKLTELETAGNDALFIRQDLPYEDSEILAEEIVQYHPDSCKMIEMYDENFEMVFSVQFDEKVVECTNISDYPELIDLLKNSKEGQTSVMIGDVEETVYFQWTENNRGENRLLLVYSAIHDVHNIWVFSFVCYMVMILLFILLIKMHVCNYNDRIKQYKQITQDMNDDE